MSTEIIDHGDIPIDLIAPNPEQPRQAFDEAGLEELAQSIREHGVIQPIVVELAPNPTPETRYILHTGERRWRAARLAGLEEIPAIVVSESTPADRLTRALIENIQRADMSPLEVAHAYARMHDELEMSDQQIADKVGKSRSAVANTRRLLKLPKEARRAVVAGGASERVMAALLPLYDLPEKALKGDPDNMWLGSPAELLKSIERGGLSSDDVRQRVDRLLHNYTKSVSKAEFPSSHVFGPEGVHSPQCDACALRVRLGNDWRCPDKDCYDLKERLWRFEQLQGAHQATGVQVGPEEIPYNTRENFYGEVELGEEIVAAGCEYLRLEFFPYGSGVLVPEHPGVRVVCLHGEGAHCQCLATKKAERTRNDPTHIEEKAKKKRLNEEVVVPATQVLDQALADGDPGAWLLVLRTVAYSYNGRGQGWDLEKVRQTLAHALVKSRLPWDAENKPDLALKAIQRSLNEVGISFSTNGSNGEADSE